MHIHQLEGRDITLSDMHACQIFLLGSPAALRLKNLHACQLVSGPVSGASFLEGSLPACPASHVPICLHA